MEPTIYFIETLGFGAQGVGRPPWMARETERVKIGFSSRLPKFRVNELQTSAPCRLGLFGHIKGRLKDERILQEYLVNFRIVGEWFYFTDEVYNVLMSLMWGLVTIEDFVEIEPLTLPDTPKLSTLEPAQ